MTASLAVSRQILHSKLALAFGCSLFDAPVAVDVRSLTSPSEVAILCFLFANVVTRITSSSGNWELARRFLTADAKNWDRLLVDRHHGK